MKKLRGVNTISSQITLNPLTFYTDKQLKQMEQMINIVRPFQTWKHFKGSIATIITLAIHSETGEELVIYECSSDTPNHKKGIYARPKSMFLEKIDKQKYPNATQEHRFELVSE